MKATFIERVDNETKFSMEFGAEEFENAQTEVYKNTRHKFAIDGFRKGKAPKKLIELRYGEDVFFEDAIDRLVSAAYPHSLDELGIEPVDRPGMDFSEIKKGEGFTVTTRVTVPPAVNAKDYIGVKVKAVRHEVADAEVDAEIAALQDRNSRLVPADRPAESGDTVLIDYAGSIDGELFEGGSAERQSLKLGSGSFIPGFEDQLIGAVPGAEPDIKVSFPEDYHAERLAGKEAVFRCLVHEVKAEEKPEINDEFAQDVSEFDTLGELKASIRQRLEDSALRGGEFAMKNSMLEAIFNANEVDIPAAMVETQIDEMMDELMQQLRYQKLDPKGYLEYIGKSPEELRESMRGDAFQKVKTRLLIKAIAEAEGIEADGDEVEKEIDALAAQYRTDPAKLREGLNDESRKLIMADVRNRKTVDFLFEKAVIEE
ncbi:MAG: trigger factor [Clostridiales Family XIII bacterium]|jgi:trigger factor|nr:trigger factor [Clostridiales Family XIII bacterium]